MKFTLRRNGRQMATVQLTTHLDGRDVAAIMVAARSSGFGVKDDPEKWSRQHIDQIVRAYLADALSVDRSRGWDVGDDEATAVVAAVRLAWPELADDRELAAFADHDTDDRGGDDDED